MSNLKQVLIALNAAITSMQALEKELVEAQEHESADDVVDMRNKVSEIQASIVNELH